MSRGFDITVDFDSAGKWIFHESVLNKMKEFVPGQSVRVQDSVANVKMLQSGDWNDLMVEVCGKRGKVEEIIEDGWVKVSFDGGVCWWYNAKCLLMDDGTSPADNPKPDDDSLPRCRGNVNVPEKGHKDAEADRDPELCESCEEEPVRYKMEPCGCYLCAECIPRKKAKKKSCAMCAEAVAEVTELR